MECKRRHSGLSNKNESPDLVYFKPNNFGKVIHCSLHNFSDAYETGYDMSAYIRLVNAEGIAHCLLLLGKSQVASLKLISIPKLEPTAATLSVKVSRMIREEIDVHINDEIFWADSQIVCYCLFVRSFETGLGR